MIQIKNITLKNFLSIGQVTQAVDFDKKDLTLILGENLDLGGDGARNGTGKTTLIQGLSYALFGVPINNIRKDNLVNRTNAKNMLVTLEFDVNGTNYKIERGRKPNILKFYVNDVQQKQKEEDTAQGENKETQQQIQKIINMTPDMFRHIVVLNTYSEPFLSLKSNEQREIIEQLLGITLLSEKAEVIKDLLRQTKDNIQQEEFNVKAIEEANKRVKEQIESLKRRQTLWINKRDTDLLNLATEYDELSKIDIEKELQAHKDLILYNQKKKQKETYDALVARQVAWQQKQTKDISGLEQQLTKLSNIDITIELQAHKDLLEHINKTKELEERDKEVARFGKEIDKEDKLIKKLNKEIETLKEHKCYACGQDFHDEQHNQVLTTKQNQLDEANTLIMNLTTEWNMLRDKKIFVIEKPTTFYKTETEAIRHSSEVEKIQEQINDKKNELDPYQEQLNELNVVELGMMPVTHYDTEREAIEHRSKVSNLLTQITSRSNESDPYSEQINEMESQALQVVNFDRINELTKNKDHQQFLLDLLTSKDSFVRKKIIDQNLSYLNARLTHYLDKIGLPHTVVFKNDLQVEITELGRDLDFDNLSRGERNRLILGLSFAFRDVWENLYAPINTLFIDELIDSGLDTMGVENSIAILKDMSRRRHKSIWLVSHREELAGRVPNVLKVIKEGGFTTYSTTTDIE
jgi:DNA repair exonuclease SbcCD ATPase subunit